MQSPGMVGRKTSLRRSSFTENLSSLSTFLARRKESRRTRMMETRTRPMVDLDVKM